MTADDIAAALLPRLPSDGRALVALVGPPASGKSTLARDLADALQRATQRPAAMMPMDGYHLDNALLDAHGTRDRKGAPWTFDVAGLHRDLRAYLQDAGTPLRVPVFDRDLDLARAFALEIPPETQVLVVEGNYLLLETAPWAGLATLWHASVYLDVPEPELTRRLTARWAHHGWDDARAGAWIAGNDLPNARIIAQTKQAATVTVPWSE